MKWKYWRRRPIKTQFITMIIINFCFFCNVITQNVYLKKYEIIFQRDREKGVLVKRLQGIR